MFLRILCLLIIFILFQSNVRSQISLDKLGLNLEFVLGKVFYEQRSKVNNLNSDELFFSTFYSPSAKVGFLLEYNLSNNVEIRGGIRYSNWVYRYLFEYDEMSLPYIGNSSYSTFAIPLQIHYKIIDLSVQHKISAFAGIEVILSSEKSSSSFAGTRRSVTDSFAVKDTISMNVRPGALLEFGINFNVDKNGSKSFSLGLVYCHSLKTVYKGALYFYEEGSKPSVPNNQNNLKPSFKSEFMSNGSSINLVFVYRFF